MIHPDLWLEQAKRLSIGMTVRIKHGRERRANMTIGNERGRWWCYCQACKEGGVVDKDHVLLSAPVEVRKEDLVVPNDLAPVLGSEYEITVGKFLASKGVMFPYLPKLWYSVQAKRLFLQDSAGYWHGRDLTGVSNQKWLHYGTKFVGNAGGTGLVVVTEDLFSKFKIEYAMRSFSLDVACTLGAGVSAASALALKNYTVIVWAYDGDKAGDDGFRYGMKRMQPFVPRHYRARPPEGLDPKDMYCEDIRKMILEAR